MANMQILFACLAASLLTNLQLGDGARILAVFPFPSPSHTGVLSGLTKALAGRGHQLVVASPYPLKTPVANYTDVDLMPALSHTLMQDNLFETPKINFFNMAFLVWDMCLDNTELVLKSPQMKKIMEDEKGFDLVILELFSNEAFYGLAVHFKAPLVMVCPHGGFHWHGYGQANPAPPSYVPNAQLTFSDKMTFTERLINTLFALAWDTGMQLFYLPRQEAIRKSVFGSSTPSIYEMNSLPSLVLLNQHFTLNYPRPLQPNIIEVGGMHVSRETKPLAKDFKDFLDGAKEGAIYFSMGSNLKCEQMDPGKIKAFVDAFAELPQKVVWKWDAETPPGKLEKLKVASWMPQQEILAHPNVKVFITHGGLLSAQEAAYHGKTLVGIPIFGDQMLNMKRAHLSGFAVLLEYNNITKESVLWALKEALHNPKIKDASRLRSVQYRDQPEPPLERAIFWTEYVLRHKGAKNLKSAGTELQWFQLCLLDVYATILTPVILLLWLCKCCCCGGVKSSAKNLKAKKNK